MNYAGKLFLITQQVKSLILIAIQMLNIALTPVALFNSAFVSKLRGISNQMQSDINYYQQIPGNHFHKYAKLLELLKTVSNMALEKALIYAGIDILSSTVGLVAGKVYDVLTNKLKDGDLTDEKLREVIVRDLNDIKSKLDCLSLKDLKASHSFLKEGVELLNLTLDPLEKAQRASASSADEATRVVNDTASGVLNAALSLPQEIQRLKTSSDKRFVSSQECFKASREAATHAFNNESLSIKDRIMACKLRVAARILQSGLEDPEAAITACLLSLKELHGLPAIQEMFAVFLQGGWQSRFNKSERLEIKMSVLFINHALYDFTTKYSCSKSRFLFAWPGIELRDRTFYPILNADEVLRKRSTSIESFQQLKQVDIGSSVRWINSLAVNSRGDIFLLHDNKITSIYSTGGSKDVMFSDIREKNLIEYKASSVAVDSDDNVYVIKQRALCDENGNTKYYFVVYAFDENYNIKNVCVLDFLFKEYWTYVNIAVDKNQNLIKFTRWNNQVYVCDNMGKLKSQFERDRGWLRSLSISRNNDIMIVSHDLSAVHTYSTDGDLKSTIRVPDGHKALHVAFHYGICQIIVITYVQKEHSYFLLSYSETGELENSVFFCKEDGKAYLSDTEIENHPSEPVAVWYKKSACFIYEYELFNFCADNRFNLPKNI